MPSIKEILKTGENSAIQRSSHGHKVEGRATCVCS
jgi:hypothetical protein